MTVLFSEDFESGAGQWVTPASMLITTADAFDGTHSQTFVATGSGYGSGASVTNNFAVAGGQSYKFSVAYKTLGDAGFIGIAYLDSGLAIVGGDWLFGDGSYPSALQWEAGLIGVWKEYSCFTTAPPNAVHAFIYDEDFGGGGAHDPAGHPIYFDGIRLESQGGYWGIPCRVG